jgi:hypothetical protein
MNKIDKELTREEKDYLISRVLDKMGYDEDFSNLTEKQEEALVDSILEKLQKE